MAKLILDNLHKTYYKNKEPIHAVSDLNIETNDGEFVALLGPSGCGKSTTLRMIAGLEGVTSGNIRIGDHKINDLHPKDRNIGLAFENYAMYPPLSVYENISFNMRAKNVPRQKIKKQVEKISDLLDIKDLLHMNPSALSGGQKQRVNIARALIRRPEVLLLDEPLSHLDGKVRHKMRTEIKHLHNEIKCTTIIVTHDQLEAMALADRIAIIKDGVLQQFGTPLEVFNHPVNEFVAGFIGEPPMNIFSVFTKFKDGNIYFTSKNEKLQFKVPDKYVEFVQEGKEYHFGIRPTDISVITDDHPDSIDTNVTVFENLGEESRIHIKIEEDNILSIVSEEIYPFDTGDHIKIKFDTDRIHIFDIETGGRIENTKVTAILS
ncbi:carbohydrate ABC transporter ATP-binding protein, CUT1 family (TC 3.A.1.1.-) [Gracilibacillus orientalis]|uniref:Carbohydrate ABC transporter ATP-binding protein, CUT1 family (TC 3.A.1.1.-) n=1 Tax=Gracilibacillus orientalis TaxID=334253 RepID=A0A1I4NNM4_9BACI|nr:ABC transporter ATP-binding protein [Gracilibacillus orientalis]SFM17118.1 carbohydrate ABC transporter ATP-binding protein, CUT1 family (TC 3.A.1.1.-) [Gracilibacillus orientalis]